MLVKGLEKVKLGDESIVRLDLKTNKYEEYLSTELVTIGGIAKTTPSNSEGCSDDN